MLARRRVLSSFSVVLLTVAALAVPAGASSTPSGLVGPATTATTTPGPAIASALPSSGNDRPLSLTALMLDQQANASGLDLSTYLSRNGASLGFGDSSLWSATDRGQLNDRLSEYVFGGADMDFTSLQARLAKSAGTPDGLAVASGISLSRRLSGLSADGPALPELGPAATIMSARPDELMFGLFANQTLAQAVLNAPDLLGQIQASGTFGPGAYGAFQAAMGAASGKLSAPLASGLPSPCTAGMLMAASSGSPQSALDAGVGSGCGACLVAGQYVHNRLPELLSGGTAYVANPNDGQLSPFEWSNLDPASRKAILQLNPELQRQIDAVQNSTGPTTAAQSCAASSAGTASVLSNNLGSVLGGLGG